MSNVYIEARPKGRPHGDPIDDYVVEDHASHVLAAFKTQHEAIDWAKRNGHAPLVARVRHLNDKKKVDHCSVSRRSAQRWRRCEPVEQVRRRRIELPTMFTGLLDIGGAARVLFLGEVGWRPILRDLTDIECYTPNLDRLTGVAFRQLQRLPGHIEAGGRGRRSEGRAVFDLAGIYQRTAAPPHTSARHYCYPGERVAALDTHHRRARTRQPARLSAVGCKPGSSQTASI